MSTEEPNPVRSFDLTVLCAQGTFNPLFSTYVVIQIGEQCQRTKGRHGIKKPVWNETRTFTITAASIRDTVIKIRLYRGSLRMDDILLGETEEHLVACEPRNTDIVKGLEKSGKTSGFDITFRIGDTKFSGHRSRIQALIIGVNKYPKIRRLKGCVNDALAMKTLLSDRFHVPDDQIKLLLDESATRDAIISYLREGFTHADCDAIVIYFAGHGSRIAAPPDWPYGDQKIETICPYDIGLKDPKTRKRICGIEDYHFNILLHELAARKKNNNITVILDSCHSAGASRDDDDAQGVRGVETNFPIPSDWKQVLASATANRDGQAAIPRNFRYNYLSSHVLLAACGQFEQALEVGDSESKPGQGRFTTELVKYIYQNPVDDVTNQQLIALLPQWSTQHPQCVGHHSHRILFDSETVGTYIASYALTVMDGILQVGIGNVGGIVEGTEFTACLPDRPKLVATSVTAHSSILACVGPNNAFPPQTRVEVSNWKHDSSTLKIFLSSESDPGLSRVLQDDLVLLPLASGSPSALASEIPCPTRKFILTDSEQTSDIKLTITQSDSDSAVEVVINRLDPLTSTFDPSQTAFKLDRSELRYLPHILNRVSRFHFYLRNYNPDAPFKDQISVQFFELAGTMNTCTPLPENLFTTHARPHTVPVMNGHAHIIEDHRKRYGFLISNYSSSDVFPYLFYFDPRGYQIKNWHSPNEPVLALSDSAPSEMRVGFGAGGGFPFVFSVPSIPNVSSDAGFLKLFVSTERIPSLAHIDQLNPLKPQEGDRAGDRSAPIGGLWDVWIGAITVKHSEE